MKVPETTVLFLPQNDFFFVPLDGETRATAARDPVRDVGAINAVERANGGLELCKEATVDWGCSAEATTAGINKHPCTYTDSKEQAGSSQGYSSPAQARAQHHGHPRQREDGKKNERRRRRGSR